VVLDKGRVCFYGSTEEAVEQYTKAIDSDSTVFFPVDKLPRKYGGNQDVHFLSFRFDRAAPIFSSDEDFSFLAKIRAAEDVPQFCFSVTIFTAEGVPIGSCSSAARSGLPRGKDTEVEVSIPNSRLAPGHYHCGVTVGKGDHRTGQVEFDVMLDTLAFEVRPEEGADGTVSTWHRNWGSIIFPDLIQSSHKNGDGN
jgi:lipopolysaccharide transport system ATP-binding protein